MNVSSIKIVTKGLNGDNKTSTAEQKNMTSMSTNVWITLTNVITDNPCQFHGARFPLEARCIGTLNNVCIKQRTMHS